MEKIDINKLKKFNVGIVGHIDHGKTTLLQKLSGKWADTHSEELKRGITIKLGYADAIVKDEKGILTIDRNSSGEPLAYLTFVDAPGHEMLMATMLSGAAIMDAAILVVAANEGIKPQTREHLTALETKKIKNIIIAQNKIDLVTKEKALESYKQLKEFVKGTIAENSPIIPISAQQGINIDKILNEILNIKEGDLKDKKEEGTPIFLIARSFDINKPGTPIKDLHGGILGGVLKKGKLKVGDTIEIRPGHSYKKHNDFFYEPIKSKIISIHQGDFEVKETSKGGSIALETELDPSLTKADSLSGNIASIEGILPETSEEIEMKYKLFDKVIGNQEHQKIENIKVGEFLMLSINTTTTVGQVLSVKEDKIKLKLKIPIVPLEGESVGIARNFNSHWRLVGFGEIE